MIPWWAYLYLAILGLLTFAGLIEELKKPGGILYAVGTFLSFSILSTFIVAVFIFEVAAFIGSLSILMLALVLFYDFYLSGRNLMIGSKHFGEPLDDVKSRMDLMTATLIVVPGYLAGIYIVYQTLTQ